jgi:hypothetical protein
MLYISLCDNIVYQYGKSMDLNPFYIQKVFSQIVVPVNNACSLRALLVETKMYDQSKKLLKQKLPGSYSVFGKHEALNSTRDAIFCSLVDRCSEEKIQARSVTACDIPGCILVWWCH